ncbi:unnamed protein product [Parnassius mnemosyne]|uniref:Nose resistant-to-fluoxetine protein N-terminal domain-containing protein n=1 Tax=Parnassius mnemosyne TaxID=213953 RepID=A0AAV1LZD5_9NEOP
MNETKSLLVLFCASLFVMINGHLTIGENTPNPFDTELYEKVLDSELCQKQIQYMLSNNSILLAQFLDAGIRLPRGFLDGNSVDLGNYQQCLGIDVPFENSNIVGKYCTIQVPLNQELNLPGLFGSSEPFYMSSLKYAADTEGILQRYNAILRGYRALSGVDLEDRSTPGGPFQESVLRLAVCIPQPCTTQEAISALLFNVNALGFEYNDYYCRLPNDKQWVPADNFAVVIFTIIGFLTLLSTTYELIYIYILKKDPKTANFYYCSFSLYNNTRCVLSFPKSADTLLCLHGIRTIATLWVIIGHAFSSLTFLLNPTEIFMWMVSAESTWITAAPITVDTFFVMTGILLVFTTAKKSDGMTLVKNIHLFYLNRLLRMLPLLAVAVLLEASIFHRVADGPDWNVVARNAHRCRAFWWTTLLHMQNYLNPNEMCIPHSWYLAIDIQLHILSPLLLFWLLSGKRHIAWSALMATLAVTLGGSAIYNYFMELPSHTVAIARGEELTDYMTKYYFHIMSRMTPFVVGMVYGYVLHLWHGRKIKIHPIVVLISWAITFGIISVIFYILHRVKQLEWDDQAVDTILNTLMRPMWAVAIGWIVLACVHGYGGPINWFLSLYIWQLPSRLSYGMYLFHFPIIFIANDAKTTPQLFSVPIVLFRSLSYIILSFIVSFVLTVVIDNPFTNIFKRLLEKGES